MPDARTIISILKNAGLEKSEVIPAKSGRRGGNSPGFRIQASPAERRAIHVYHVGKGARLALNKYAAALIEAGFVVEKEDGGLRVTSLRSQSA